MDTHRKENPTLKTPVLLLMYNRPDLALKVFYEIRKVRPEKLYLAVDGPKNDSDQMCINLCKEIENLVDWPCEINKLYREKNLGCKLAVSSAIDWFFYHEERGIILEDDCLPEKSFFYYCEEMLNYYNNDESVGHISGSNFLKSWENEESYYFSNYAYVWGWATWRRAWKAYDVNMNDLLDKLKKKNLNDTFSFSETSYWKQRLIKTYQHKIDTWDYQWSYALWAHKLKAIVPTKNLISNIGFDHRATHTFRLIKSISHRRTEALHFIIHPKTNNINTKKDSDSFHNILRKSMLAYSFMYFKNIVALWKIEHQEKKQNPTTVVQKSWSFRLF